MGRKKVSDTPFEYVAGPMRVGDEHPGQRGWFYTGQYDRKGVLLWYKPPGLISRWIKRIALVLYVALMGLGMFAAFFIER